MNESSTLPLDRLSKPLLWIVTFLLVLLMAWIDYVTGYELSFFLFYSLPILVMVRYADRASAVVFALLCGAAWWLADYATGHPYDSPWLRVWETSMRVAYFLLVALAGTSLRSYIELLQRTRGLEQEIIRISEREQQRIGQDLHDGLCQYFAAVGCAAGSLKQRLEEGSSPAAEEAREIETLIMQGVSQTRGLARGLFPVEDDEGGLQSALEELAENTNRLQNIRCVFQCAASVPIRENASATHLFRIAQEALNNALRHGLARAVTIRLSEEKGTVRLSITDDGLGIPERLPERRGLGLSIMQYRARTIGGQLKIERRPEGGTLVSCTLTPPVQPTEIAA